MPPAIPSSGSAWSSPLSLGGLAAGGSLTVVIEAQVKANTSAGVERISNTASVGSGTDDDDASNDSATATTDVETSADLEVDKSAADDAFAGNNLTYTLTVTNTGPSDNVGFTLEDVLPAGTSFVDATGPDCANAAGTVTCTSAGLAAGADVTWTITVTISSAYLPGDLTNSASIATNTTTDPEAGNDSDDAVTAVTRSADLEVDKSAADDAFAGNNLTYTLTVTNTGPSDNVGFTLEDVLPAGTGFVDATSPDCANAAGTVTCTSAGLAAGADVTSTITVTISSAYLPGDLTNSASIATNTTTDPEAGNDSDDAVTAVTRSADLWPTSRSCRLRRTSPARSVTYTITVINHGPSDAQDVELADSLDPYLTNPLYCIETRAHSVPSLTLERLGQPRHPGRR